MSCRNSRIATSLASILLLWTSACHAPPLAADPAPAVDDAQGDDVAPTTSGAVADPPPAAHAGFAGVWHTSYGSMRLAQVGSHVTGRYSYGGGSSIEGEVKWGTLDAFYTEPDGTRGRASFELDSDGKSFRGAWNPDPNEFVDLASHNRLPWYGTRAVPVPDRVWLVILEAHWEESLDEHEFSYGAMLRSFFERLPNVEVRHRFFHDRADLVRFCHDVGDLVEPVVVYISTHGAPEGIVAGPDHIDGAMIGEALRDTGDLKLVHLGGCGLLAGDLGAKLRAAAAPHAAFPISGFTQDVDWAGSAIVDFTYLDLVLEKGLEPDEAVRSVRSMVTFAGAPGRTEDEFDGTDLTLVGPMP